MLPKMIETTIAPAGAISVLIAISTSFSAEVRVSVGAMASKRSRDCVISARLCGVRLAPNLLDEVALRLLDLAKFL